MGHAFYTLNGCFNVFNRVKYAGWNWITKRCVDVSVFDAFFMSGDIKKRIILKLQQHWLQDTRMHIGCVSCFCFNLMPYACKYESLRLHRGLLPGFRFASSRVTNDEAHTPAVDPRAWQSLLPCDMKNSDAQMPWRSRWWEAPLKIALQSHWNMHTLSLSHTHVHAHSLWPLYLLLHL